MRKILFYVYSLNKGGAERVLLTICEELKKTYNITILTDSYAEKEYTLPFGIKRIVINDENKQTYNPIKRIYRIRRICKKEKPDLVIAFMISSAIRAIISNILAPVKVVAAVRSNPYDGYGTRKGHIFLNTIFAFAQGVICQTNFQKAYFKKKIQKKCCVILNPIQNEFSVFIDNEKRDNRIVTVGRLYDYKNHAMLIKAFSKLADEYPMITLTIYGEGPYRQETEHLIHKLNMDERIFLPGDVSDVAKHIKDAYMFVLPSDTEGLPNALMEAMVMQLPCIATDCPCGGPKTLITNGENGLLCMVNDVDDLYNKMKLLLDNKELAMAIGEKAGKITEMCSINKICKLWRDYIEEVCQ